MIEKYKQYIGILSTKFDEMGDVYFNKSNFIQFKIQLLNSVHSDCEIACFFNKFPEEMQIDDPDLPPETRIRKAQEWLNNRLFFFFVTEKSWNYVSATIITSIEKPSTLQSSTPYIAIPVFAPNDAEEEKNWQKNRKSEWPFSRAYNSYDDWLKLMSNDLSLGRIYGIDSQEDIGPFIFWRESQELFAVGKVSRTQKTNNIHLGGDANYRVSVDEFRNQFIYDTTINPSLAFIPMNIFNKIKAKLFGMEIPAETVAEHEALMEQASKYEEQIIDAMYSQCNQHKLGFRKKELINLHLAIKCNPLVFLTGKTKNDPITLMNIYTHALGIYPTPNDSNPQYYIIEHSNLKDDVELIGRPDYNAGVYRPSESGFIDALIHAKQHPDQLFIICLDGINICQQQVYIDLFKMLVKTKKSQRFIQLYPSNMEKHLSNSDYYPHQISIGNNVRVIGILNETKDSMIPYEILKQVNIIHVSEQNTTDSVAPASFSLLHDKTSAWTSTAYNELVAYYTSHPLLLDKIITEINEKITSVNQDLAISTTQTKAITIYCKNAMLLLDNQFSLETAADYQIAQRILTMIRGTAEDWGHLLDDSKDSLLYLLDQYRQISSFEECKNVIARKREQLEQTGFIL